MKMEKINKLDKLSKLDKLGKSAFNGLAKRIGEAFNKAIRISKAERDLLLDAIENHNGEVIEPANDNVKAMEAIVNLYNKKLVEIDFEKDKLFVSKTFCKDYKIANG